MAEPQKTVSLALQGGGSHGAYTWGVLERLLEDGRLRIEAISGTSAGAMNAVVLANGMRVGGRKAAIAALEAFWRRVATIGRFGPFPRTPLDRLAGGWSLDGSPAMLAFDVMSRLLSPYQFNPFDWHPLRTVLAEQVNFAALRGKCEPQVFVTATSVLSGKIKIFRPDELSVETCLASACLPFLFQAVKIGDDAFWDGGYSGNPALYPLIYNADCRDILLVHVNPIKRDEVPTTAAAIIDRLNEITFNASLMREMRAIEFVTRLLEEQRIDEHRYKRLLIHMVDGTDDLRDYGTSSKLNADWDFLSHLRALGRSNADRWLGEHFAAVGERSSIDVKDVFL
ncbi:MAG: patatin-like phospholipase family protein [Alphaproteobacteria bacterium]